MNTQLMTAEELLRLPRGQWRYELINGELRQMTPAGHHHGDVAAQVLGCLWAFVREHRLGKTYAAETGFILRRHPDTVRAADASFVSHAKLEQLTLPDHGYFPGPPELAIEVISPSDTYTEVEEKVGEWLEAGARVVIVIDPRRQSAKIHRAKSAVEILGKEDALSAPELLPGWSVKLSELFA